MATEFYTSLKDAKPFDQVEGFKGEFTYPLLYGITGTATPRIERINQALECLNGEVGGFYLDALWLAELVVSSKDSKQQFFIEADMLRRMFVGLNEGTNGWALIIGKGGKDVTTIEELKDVHSGEGAE